MRMRDQLIVIIAVAFATITVAANVFAQVRAEDHRAENERIAAAAAWAQPIVVSTTSAPDTTFGSTDKTDPPAQADNGVSRAPGQNPEDCTPPGQVDRDDKNTPPGQDRDMCVPPGQDKDKDTPPGQVDRDEDKNTPPGQDKKDEETSTPPGQVDRVEDKNTPPGQDKKDEETSTPPGQDKDKDDKDDD